MTEQELAGLAYFEGVARRRANERKTLLKCVVLTFLVFLVVTVIVLFFPQNLKTGGKLLGQSKSKTVPSTRCHSTCK